MSDEDWAAVIALADLQIPSSLQRMVGEIVGITDSVCLAVLAFSRGSFS